MARKNPHPTEREPPAETDEKIPSSGISIRGGSPRASFPAGHYGPAPPQSSSPPRDKKGPVRDALTLTQLRYFMAVCDTLSFTHAARKCGVSQPALLRAIRKLENAIGARLFRLQSARLRPTELAQLLRPQLQLIVATAEAAREAAGKFAAEHPMAENQGRKKRRRKR